MILIYPEDPVILSKKLLAIFAELLDKNGGKQSHYLPRIKKNKICGI